MRPVAVVLSGCGVFDGAEIHESVLTLLALSERGIPYQCVAPDIKFTVVDHISGDETEEKRAVLTEAARIARGEIVSLDETSSDQYSAVIFPGGFGAAKNLSSFAKVGKEFVIDPTVEKFAKGFIKDNKPVCFICIAPHLAPRLFDNSVKVTIGNDQATAQAIESLGGNHEISEVTDIVVDEANRVISTPAYMLANSISDARIGIEKMVDVLQKWIG